MFLSLVSFRGADDRVVSSVPQPDDPFVAEVFYLLPPDAVRGMSSDQQQAFKEALRRGATRHSLDIRLTLPLFFTQFYVVFQAGKDRRREVVKELKERKRGMRDVLGSGGILIGAILVFVVGFAALYSAKSAMGINLFKNDHLQDFVPFAPLSKK